MTKKDLHTDYRKGVVWYKEVRVGEYAGGKMHLKGEGTKVEALFTNYMESRAQERAWGNVKEFKNMHGQMLIYR